MTDINLERTWSHRLVPVLSEVWSEARREIHMASRMEMDDNVWTTSSPDHMGDPAMKVDRLAGNGATRPSPPPTKPFKSI